MKPALESHEQIVRKVTSVGNGAHVFTPREWMGEEIILIRPSRKEVKEEILDAIGPHLEDVIGVYLYGSRARGEAEASSDKDVLVISTRNLKINHPGLEIISMTETGVSKSTGESRLMLCSSLAEAKPILNAPLLEKLKKICSLRKKDIESFIKSSKESLAKSDEILIIDKEKGEYASEAAIYSLVLRLRGVYIIACLLNKIIYSKKGFDNWVISKGLPKEEYKKAHEIYLAKKSGRRTEIKLEVEIAQRASNILKAELQNIS